MEMDKLRRSLSLVALLGLCLMTSVDSCKCRFTEPEELYCQADFVINMKVTDSRIVNTTYDWDNIQYSIETAKVLKSIDKYWTVDNRSALYTATESAACGVMLDIGTSYTIGGYVRDGTLSIDSCSSLVENVNSFRPPTICSSSTSLVPTLGFVVAILSIVRLM